jgi:hypothetical protein
MDPVHRSVFEVYFTLPPAIQQEFKQEEALLTEQVTNVTGLDALQKTPGVGEQKFFGVVSSFANPTFESTAADIEMQLNLNLRNVTDNFVLKVFKAWANLNYDLSDGTRTIKMDYIADNLRVAEANRNGEVWRSYIFHNLILNKVEGLNELDYTNNEAAKLTVGFRSDYWDDDMG